MKNGPTHHGAVLLFSASVICSCSWSTDAVSLDRDALKKVRARKHQELRHNRSWPFLNEVLVIMSDDMRPELSGYGHLNMKTPNTAELGRSGFTFQHAYVQFAVCGPSRTSLLTGRRPDTSRVWNNEVNFRDTKGLDWTTLPQFFKESGYRSIGMGKVFHKNQDETSSRGGSWSVPHGNEGDPYSAYNPAKNISSFLEVDAPWDNFRDGRETAKAIKWISNASMYEKPFFLMVGLHLPHIPYVYPKAFRYKGPKNFPPKNYKLTKDIPDIAVHDWTREAAKFNDMWRFKSHFLERKDSVGLCDALPTQNQWELKQAYLSSIQYVDFLIGKLMDALKAAEIYDQTTIVVFGDHGYKLGEHCSWFKHDNYELSTRFPLILKPSASLGLQAGRHINQLVEAVDIYPSLAEMTSLKVPGGLDGQSWLPLLQDAKATGKSGAFSQYQHKKCMGYSLRTEQFRYTEWLENNCDLADPMSKCSDPAKVKPNWKNRCGTELYDHRKTMPNTLDEGEDENLAGKPEYAKIERRLHTQLVREWKTPTS